MCNPQAKSPIVEVLEERLMKAAEDRAGAAAAAADDEDRDDLEAAQVAWHGMAIWHSAAAYGFKRPTLACKQNDGDLLILHSLSDSTQAAIGAAIGVLSSGGAMPEALQAADAAAAAADAASMQSLPEALDEFGRDMNVEKRRQARVFHCRHMLLVL